MKIGNVLVLIGVVFASMMFSIGVFGLLPTSPVHLACSLIDPPSDLENWKHSR